MPEIGPPSPSQAAQRKAFRVSHQPADLIRLGRLHPELAASVAFDPIEWQAAWLLAELSREDGWGQGSGDGKNHPCEGRSDMAEVRRETGSRDGIRPPMSGGLKPDRRHP